MTGSQSSDAEKITINLGHVDLGQIDLMVQGGFYSNRTDFIRNAIRNQLDRHADVVKQSVARRSLELGLRHYSREDLEAARAAGQTLHIHVLGLASIASDVTPELARATIASVVTSHRSRPALQLQRQLGLGSYRSAWLLCGKLRRSMVAPGRSALAGLVEIDETEIPCRSKNDPLTGSGGRSHQGKMLIVGAVEIEDGGAGPGRIRLAELSDYSADSPHPFIAHNLAPGTTAKTDGWSAYPGAPNPLVFRLRSEWDPGRWTPKAGMALRVAGSFTPAKVVRAGGFPRK